MKDYIQKRIEDCHHEFKELNDRLTTSYTDRDEEKRYEISVKLAILAGRVYELQQMSFHLYQTAPLETSLMVSSIFAAFGLGDYLFEMMNKDNPEIIEDDDDDDEDEDDEDEDDEDDDCEQIHLDIVMSKTLMERIKTKCSEENIGGAEFFAKAINCYLDLKD